MAFELDELKNIIRDIKAIAFHMSVTNDSNDRKAEGADLKMGDLSEKLNRVESLFGNLQSEKITSQSSPKKHYNVAIVSIIDNEFEALNELFDFKNVENRQILSNGLRVWTTTFKQKINDNKELTLLFAKTKDPGNLSSFVVTNELLKEFDIDLMILCGIAAGVKGNSTIYSAGIGKKIVYYELQKLNDAEIQYRFEPLSISSNLANEIDEVNDERWKLKLFQILRSKKLMIKEADLSNKTWIDPSWKDKLHIFSGVVFAGEKLLADGQEGKKLAKKNQVGKEVVAFEMEGYGFAFACKQNTHSNWLVIRGISDFGGKEKSTPINEKYQKVAAYSAVALIYDYLENICSPPIIK